MVPKKTCILVVEDDTHVQRLEQLTLEKEGFTVALSLSGEEALEAMAEANPALVLLDIGLPGMDGITTCQRIREFSQVPIIMVTGKDMNEEKVRGLESGADDYVTKPFLASELTARVKAALRRSTSGGPSASPSFLCGDLLVDFARNRVSRAGQEVFLSSTEYRLLCYLTRNAGRIVTRDQILERIWGEEYLGEAHLLHVTIGRLRQKLGDDPRKPRYIITRRGIGYSFAQEHAPAAVA